MLVRRSLDVSHEVHNCVLLSLKEPLDAVTYVLHSPSHGQMCDVGQDLHDHVSPRELPHRHASRLNHVLLRRGCCHLSKAKEHLDLNHQSSVLCASVDCHIHRRDLRLLPQVSDVVLSGRDFAGRQEGKVKLPPVPAACPQALHVVVEFVQFFVHRLTRLFLRFHVSLHHMLERVCEGHATVSDGCHKSLWVGVLQLLHFSVNSVLLFVPEIPQLFENRPDGINEHLLDLVFHEGREVRETNCLNVLL
mmetsp:Transcript_6997/g.13734  ORF Transcript_6997/g.13734 Transcript_6997/m.13734 type:complete len:248 (-) Transcript_6997:111-854(-)